jgi:hypothetical protein
MEHGPEQTRRERINLLKEAYQGDIWAFAAEQAFTTYHELLARIDDVYDALNCLRDEWKQSKLNHTVNSSCSLSPRESEKIEQSDTTRLNDEHLILQRLRNEQMMMIEEDSPPWGQNREDDRMMVEEPSREPLLIKYEKPRKYKPKFKKVYRIKLPPTEDRMVIEKEPSQKMPEPKIQKEQNRARFRRVYSRIKKRKVFVKIYVPKDMLIENENVDWRKISLAPRDDTECDRLMMIESSETEMQTRKRRQPSAVNAESSGSPPFAHKRKKTWSMMSPPDSKNSRIILDYYPVKFKKKA